MLWPFYRVDSWIDDMWLMSEGIASCHQRSMNQLARHAQRGAEGGNFAALLHRLFGTSEDWPSQGAFNCFFPTCQVRVVRFYHSCSPPPPPPPHPTPPPPPSSPPAPPPPPPLHPLPCSLPPCQLFAKLFAKLFANFRMQWALLDLNCKGLSALGTAGPQPGTFRAQWAPLDLDLGLSELNDHHWTSTWDPPSSVSTAGPQRPDRMPEDMPDRTPDRMPEDMPDKVPECLPDRMPEGMPDRMPEFTECQI